MDMKARIYKHLKGLVAIPSVSNTQEEKAAAEYLAGSLAEQAYFKKNPQLCGQFPLEGDMLGRSAVYGLVKGGGRRTIALTGHYDVVDTEEYGNFKRYAYDVEAWSRAAGAEREALLGRLTPQARADFESGEWLFGRGVNDMKGGLAVGLALTEWFGDQTSEGKGLPGNILFLSVPDEEAYSAGMRGAIPLLVNLSEEQGLEYTCLLDLEPCFDRGGKQQVYIGSVGKMLPAVLVQGAKAHVVEAFDGLNAVGVLAQLFMETELAPEFAETYQGEICPPPTWFNLRDRKEGYDVSVPLRAGGYMSVLGFEKTAEGLMERLKDLGQEAFEKYLERMERQRKELGIAGEAERPGTAVAPGEAEKPGTAVSCGGVPPYSVMEYRELAEYCAEKYGREALSDWQKRQQREAAEMVRAGTWSYPQATLELMDRLLTWSGITVPVMVLAYAPPYYPAFHSDRLEGCEINGSQIFDMLAGVAAEFGLQLEKGNYFGGISDLSYCGAGGGRGLDCYASDAPLWGGLYSMDLEAMARFWAPSLLFGPVGRDAHQMGERVKTRSLLEEVPAVLRKFIEQMFANGMEM